MKLFNIKNGIAVSTWMVFLQLSIEFAESNHFSTTEMNTKNHSSQRFVAIQRETRNVSLARQNHQQEDNGKDFVRTTNEFFMPMISDLSELKNESFVTTGLSITEEKTNPFNLAAFNKVEQLAFPLDVDMSSLPISDSIENPSFPNFIGESESKSDAEDSETHQIGDFLIDPKRIDAEPFLTILVNSPPQVVTESSEPQSSSISPSNLVDAPLSYLHVRVPISPSASTITIAPLSLLPLEPVSPFLSSGVSPEKVEISSSVKYMNRSSMMDEKKPKSANLTVFPLVPPASVIFDLKSYSGQQVLTHNSNRNNLYQLLPPLFGILYPIAPQTWIAPPSFGTQFQFDQSKFNLATPYGTPRTAHPLYGYGNDHRKMFGTPPTPRALGFPPIANTHDNFRHEVNWAKAGRAYR